MYNLLVFLHIFLSLLLMLGHGAHAAAMLKFRGELDPERSLTFFNNVPDIKYVRYLTMAMGLFGFAPAFMTIWWRQWWIWLSVLVFLIVSWVMFRYGAGYYNIIEGAATRLIEARKTNVNLPAAEKDFDDARNSPYPMLVSVVGIVGLAVILWLMRFKPF